MSSSDLPRHKYGRLLPAAAAFCALLALGGCKVQPLYGSAGRLETGAVDPSGARIASMEFAPVGSREAQQVRNHLIFLANGGQGQPASPAYKVELSVISQTESVAVIQTTTRDEEPTAGSILMTGSYTIRDVADGSVVATGSRAVSASFDRPIQPFADYRAERDAQDRAARELAEVLHLALVLDIRKARGAGGS